MDNKGGSEHGGSNTQTIFTEKTYYRSFMLLVVIPLVLVFIGAELAVSDIIRNSAIETIEALQDTVATTLNGDVRTNALHLSYFVYAQP